MLHDPARHEALQARAWDSALAEASIQRIVRDTEARFTPGRCWPTHPRDLDGDEDPTQVSTTLYLGACGVIWALHYLQAVGATRLSRNYLGDLDEVLKLNRLTLKAWDSEDYASYLMGDTPIEMLAFGDQPDAAREERLAALVAGNIDHPTRELM